MKFLSMLLVSTILQAQAASFVYSPQFNYSNQFTGINGWPNNGRHGFQDTTRATWCLDGNTYVSGNDGYGPNYILGFGTGRNIFLTTMTPFTVPSAGNLQLLTNSMDSFGNSATDVYGNGTTLKSSGMLCNFDTVTSTEIFYWSTYQQESSINDQFGTCTNIMRSDDHGATWWNPSHINHATGVPTQAGSAAGDLPTVSSCMFPTDIKSLVFFQYCQGNQNCIVVDGNNSFIYCLAETQFGTHMYGCRVANADIRKSDGTLYQWYKGPVPTSTANFANSANWSFTESDHVAIEPTETANITDIIAPPIYLPAPKRYIIVIGTLTSLNEMFQGVTPNGPWSLLYNFPGSPPEGWHAPVLQSLATAVATTTVNYLVTNGPGGINTGNPSLNTYGPMFHIATFLPYFSTVIRGSSKISGVTAIR